jgi:flavodoxin
MKAIVVYESIWGNTATVAKAIAEGIGAGAKAISTADAGAAALSGADLLIVGAPVLGFGMPRAGMLASIASNQVRYK